MSGDRCEVCDRVECPAVPFLRMNCDEYDEATAADDGAAAQAARDDCDANAVNWREMALAYRASHDFAASRCLAAERDRDEAVARAERAEAECGVMRALAFVLDRWREWVDGESHIGGPDAALITAVDKWHEWRRTRQGKEGT